MDAMTALRVVVSLAVVFAAVWLIAKQARRRGAAAPGKAAAVRVLGKAGVAQKASVVVVETEGRRLVLGVTEHGVSVLHAADAPAEAQESFAEVLARTPEPEPAPKPSWNPRQRLSFRTALLDEIRDLAAK